MFSFWTRVLPRATAVSLCRFRFNRVWAHVLCFSIPVSSVQAIVIGETCAFAWRRHRSPWTVLRARVAVRFEIYSSALCCAYTTLVKNFGGTCLFSMNRPARLARGMFRFQLHPPSIFPWTTLCFMLVLESSWGPSGWRFLGISFMNLKVCVRFAGTCFACFCGTSALVRQLRSCC